MRTLFLLLPLACGLGCASKPEELNQTEKEALAKLDAEADAEAVPDIPVPESARQPDKLKKKLIPSPPSVSDSAPSPALSAQCYEFKFFNQTRIPLNRDPVTLCQGDPDRQVFLQSAQGRSAILNLSPDALIDPVEGITFVSARKLLCFDHNVAPNARWPWTGQSPVINCCSDVSFERSESGSEARILSGRVEGPPPNCGQD